MINPYTESKKLLKEMLDFARKDDDVSQLGIIVGARVISNFITEISHYQSGEISAPEMGKIIERALSTSWSEVKKDNQQRSLRVLQ